MSKKIQQQLSTLISYSIYTRSSHDSTDLAIGNLSDKLQQQSFMLQDLLNALRKSVDSVDDDNVSIIYSTSLVFPNYK